MKRKAWGAQEVPIDFFLVFFNSDKPDVELWCLSLTPGPRCLKPLYGANPQRDAACTSRLRRHTSIAVMVHEIQKEDCCMPMVAIPSRRFCSFSYTRLPSSTMNWAHLIALAPRRQGGGGGGKAMARPGHDSDGHRGCHPKSASGLLPWPRHGNTWRGMSGECAVDTGVCQTTRYAQGLFRTREGGSGPTHQGGP